MKRIAILGSALSGGAAQIIEALHGSIEKLPVIILDNSSEALEKEIMGIKVTGFTDDVEKFWKQNLFDEAIIAIGGNLSERKRLFDYLIDKSIPLANIIDPSVKFGFNCKLGVGNVILNNTYFGNFSEIGNNNYILNQCSIQHDSKIGNHNYFATNVTVGAKVKIGSLNRLGIKSVVETHGKIEDNTTLKSMEIIQKV